MICGDSSALCSCGGPPFCFGVGVDGNCLSSESKNRFSEYDGAVEVRKYEDAVGFLSKGFRDEILGMRT